MEILYKRGEDLTLLKKVIDILREEKVLPSQYKDHKLKGDYIGARECHIQPDFLFIYYIKNNILTCTRAGSHADLF
jgi:mRNA interferase YafQ